MFRPVINRMVTPSGEHGTRRIGIHAAKAQFAAFVVLAK